MDIDIGYKAPAPTNTDDVDKLKEELSIFFNGIIRIEKTRRVSAKDGGNWRFIMKYGGKQEIIDIENKYLTAGPKALNDSFFYVFGRYLPTVLLKKPTKDGENYWTNFCLIISKMAVEVDPDESEEWIETDRFIENIAKLNITEDKKVWYDTTISDKCLLKTERGGITYYCAKPDMVVDIKKAIDIKMSIEQLGKVLNSRGYKMSTNEKMTGLGNHRPKAWWFYASVIEGVMPFDEKAEECAQDC